MILNTITTRVILFNASSIALLALLMTTILPHDAVAQDRKSSLKAAYIYYFTKFVYWPTESSTRRVCALGSSQDISDALDKVAQKSAGNIEVEFLEQTPDLDTSKCDIVFISNNLAKGQQVNQGTLLVVDEDIQHPEAAVKLVVVNNKLAFVINRTNAKSKNIEISAKLLGLAREVQE